MWTEEEDEELRGFVAQYGVKKWAFISTKMSTGKGAKQCRRRWQNYLNNDLKQGGWTEEEDRVLLEGHRMHGNKWTEIARMVGGRTDNAVKNRHAVLVKKEEQRQEDADDAPSAGKRKRASDDDPGGSSSRKAKRETPSSTPNAASGGSWRPNLSVKIPSSSTGGSNLPTTSSTRGGAPPSLEELPTSASLTAAEIDLLKQVQELISPRAEGFSLPTSARAGSRGLTTTPAATLAPNSPLDTPTVDLQQVMNWIMSVTPRAGGESGTKETKGKDGGGANANANANASGAGASGSTRATRGAAAKNAAEAEQGQHSALLRKLLTEKLSGSPAGSPREGGRGSPRGLPLSHTPVGMDLANGLPASPNFTSSELNLLMNALGGGGETPTSGLMGGINPFGRAADNLTSPPEGGKERGKKK
jgi:hypothetical protein